MRRLKTVRRPPIYPKTPGHLPCSSLTHPLPLSSRRPSVSFGGFGLSCSPEVVHCEAELELDMGGTARTADYQSHDGAEVVYAYTVQAGDTDDNGISTGANKLTGQQIKDAAGRFGFGISDADLRHDAVAEDAGHKVATSSQPAKSTDATLSALTLSGVDFGTFASGTISYSAQVANSVTETTVTPTVNNSNASYVIKLGGVEDADGKISLAVGSNVITVEVTAEDGNTTRTYTVTITRAEPPSTDATLSALTMSGVDFGTFAPGTTSYTAQVANTVAQTTVTPTVNHSGASYAIKLGGVTDADSVIALSVGSNVITVEVTAEDDSATRTYTVTVTRAAPPSTDATLSALTLSGVDFGTFDSTTTSYTGQVANSVTQTTITPTVNDSGASYVIKLGGVEDADGVVVLRVSSNVITVEVTAEDDSTTQTYTVTVTRAEPTTPEQAVQRRRAKRPDAQPNKLRQVRLDDHFIHRAGGQQRDPDDGDSDGEPLRGQLRHQARQSRRCRR